MDSQQSLILLISACLLGIPCRYDSQAAKCTLEGDLLKKAQSRYLLIPVCPEQLGGLPTPRTPVEIQNGTGEDVLHGLVRVKGENGEDFTEQFIRGAEAVLVIANITGASGMVSQKRSPSCGCRGIYDGSFSHTLVPGMGVTTALLQQNGIAVMELEEFIDSLS